MVESTHATGLWPSLYSPFRALGQRVSDWLSPPSDASSDDSAYRICVELPGVNQADIDLQVQDGLVIVTGEKSDHREDKGESWYFSEREYGTFRRSFRLPPDADEDAVAAAMKDGVLEITVPRRAPEAAGARRIEIRKE